MVKPDAITIISGGQSGVDRAALDFAMTRGLPCMGWCPKGRAAEDGPIDSKYPLKESIASDPAIRTRSNVAMADGMLLAYPDKYDEGTLIALRYCKDLKKPVYIVNWQFPPDPAEFAGWLSVNRIRNLNVAGPRESNAPGVYAFALSSLEALMGPEE